MEIEKKIEAMGLKFVPAPAAGGVANLVRCVRTGNLLFFSGTGPRYADGTTPRGKVGKDFTLEQGYEFARQAALNLLSRLKDQIGDLDQVTRIVKLLCMINCTPEFSDQAKVANGASDLLTNLYGDRGRHARSAVGMGSLPNQMPIEIEMIVEVPV
jgi:enamine deaminase RidA (YjgF/YER057c/UK114 family)